MLHTLINELNTYTRTELYRTFILELDSLLRSFIKGNNLPFVGGNVIHLNLPVKVISITSECFYTLESTVRSVVEDKDELYTAIVRSNAKSKAEYCIPLTQGGEFKEFSGVKKRKGGVVYLLPSDYSFSPQQVLSGGQGKVSQFNALRLELLNTGSSDLERIEVIAGGLMEYVCKYREE